MINSAVTTESAANVVNADALRRLKNAERMRASRAKAKAVAPSAEDKIAQVAEALGVEAPADLGFIRPPVEPSVEAAKKPPAKAASKPAKAGPAPKATKAVPATKPPSGKRGDVMAAAERGEIPAAPDFSAATHTRFRGKLAEVVGLVEAGNIAGLKPYKINPVSSSPKAIDKYRNLAIIALKAKA